ncbi:MAG: Hsp20/alpha crystallin family protein [Chitinophagaceae bacterium]
MTQFRTTNHFGKSFDGLLNEIFNEIPSTLGKTMREDVLGFPPVNISEKSNSYHLQLAAPGMEKDYFSIKLEGNLLTISATQKETVKDADEKTIRREFSQKAFKRSFTLDEKIDADNIKAKYENGILIVELAKKEAAQMGSKEIAIL